MKKKICIVTGTRAEYGLFYNLLKEIKADNGLELQLVATGMHLSPEFGSTYKLIEKDGFIIDKKVEILLSSDLPIGISKAIGLGLIGISDAFETLSPDIVVLLGDRFEIFAAASAATVLRIPIAHIHGGEVTLGAIDDAFRHSITKMSCLHFASTDEYRNRIIQLGESPGSVFNVGALGVEYLLNFELLPRNKIQNEIAFSFGQKCILLTFHPETIKGNMAQNNFTNILDSLDHFPDLKVIFTKSNADAEGRAINQMIDEYVQNNPDRSVAFTSMGQHNYLSTMRYMDAVVGNSSSGIIETPSFNVPTVNIGKRQEGRVKAMSVIDCSNTKEDIVQALEKAFSDNFKMMLKQNINPYEKIGTARNIKEVLKNKIPIIESIKQFYDLKAFNISKL